MSLLRTTVAFARLRHDVPGILAVAATYVYFLLFAQFAFLDLLHERLDATPQVERAMAAMGIAGFLLSLATAGLLAAHRPRRLLTIGFAGCAATAMASLLATGIWALAAAAAGIGAATAVTTVALATSLRDLIRGRRFGLTVGLGTGGAYLLCNVPPIFEGSPVLRTTVAAAACLVGLAAVAWQGRHRRPPGSSQPSPLADSRPALSRRDYVGFGFASLILSFLALIWLDSAAFAIIQETVALKGSTWGSASQKLILGATHFLAAVLGGWLIDRGFFRSLLIAAFCLFASAFTLLDTGSWLISGPIYAIGISLYSVALVAYPAYRRDEPGLVPGRWRAAIIYGVAGWLGSALGVGMAQDLHYIPRPFLWVTGALLVTAWALARNGRLAAAARAHAVTLAGGAAGALVYFLLPAATSPSPAGAETADLETSAAARGRQVYIQEGCINCHSQYVRPRSRDVELWGPHRPAASGEHPPLYGNRRQGPDLTNAGSRRPREWHRLHLVEPRTVSAGSRMPSYAHLFADDDTRGDDLVAYLGSLRLEARDEPTPPPDTIAKLAAMGNGIE